LSLVLCVLCVLWALGGTAAAQQPAGEARQPVRAFEEAIDVRVVNLEAVVTDRRGNRISGLTAEDFKLLVDGVETPITYFSAIDEAKIRVAGTVAAEAGAAAAAEPSWQSRNILVFLDEATMVKARRDFVLRAMAQQLAALAPGDQMAVVAFNGQMDVLCDWTGDRSRLAAVFEQVERRPSHGIFLQVRRREEASDVSFLDMAAALAVYDRNPFGNVFSDRSVADRDRALAEMDVEEDLFAVARWQEPIGVRVARLFDPLDRFFEVAEAAAAAMRGLPAPPGRKMLLLLTEGFSDPVFARPVVQEANRLGYSVYPVDVMNIDAQWAQNDVEFLAPQPFVGIRTGLDLGIEHGLGWMAEATGGKAAMGSNRMRALERTVEDSAAYYLLGFSPTWRGDDRRHEIELTVERPGWKVRTRESYVDPSRRTRISLDADAALLLGHSQAEKKLIVTVGEPAASRGDEELPVSLGVPVESLAFFPHEKGFRAEAPVAVVVLDDKGRRKQLPESWLTVDVEQLPLEGTWARFDFPVAAGKRGERIVVTVHDALSGEALWGECVLFRGRGTESVSNLQSPISNL
jgi:VWFA-related protein